MRFESAAASVDMYCSLASFTEAISLSRRAACLAARPAEASVVFPRRRATGEGVAGASPSTSRSGSD